MAKIWASFQGKGMRVLWRGHYKDPRPLFPLFPQQVFKGGSNGPSCLCDALGIAKSMMEGGWVEATRNVHYPQGRLRVPGCPQDSSLLTPHAVCHCFALREGRGPMSPYTLSWASRPVLSWPDIKGWRPQGYWPRSHVWLVNPWPLPEHTPAGPGQALLNLSTSSHL